MTAGTTAWGLLVSDESIPDGTFGGTYSPSKAPAKLPPVTPEQAEQNRQTLIESIYTKGKNHGKEAH